MNQLDLIDIYRLLHPTIAEYTFFPKTNNIYEDGPYLGL